MDFYVCAKDAEPSWVRIADYVAQQGAIPLFLSWKGYGVSTKGVYFEFANSAREIRVRLYPTVIPMILDGVKDNRTQ